MARKDKFDLTGRVALLTGVSPFGIANESARLLSEHGASVFLIDINEEPLVELAREINEAGGKASYCALDVSDEAKVKAAVDQCVAELGGLDIMVLAAGISGRSARGGTDLEALFDTENWKRMQEVNLDSIFYFMKHGQEYLAKSETASIVNISSVGCLRSLDCAASAAYNATKAAVKSISAYFARAFAPQKIRVNSICPGFINSNLMAQVVAYAPYRDGRVATIPVGRYGEPDDIAYGVLYLASDAGSFVNGENLVIDGGEVC